MKKIIFFAFICLFLFSLSAKVTIFLNLDKTGKEPRLKPDTKCEDGKTFSDDVINIVWEPLADGFRFELTNKSKAILTIPWEECAFVNEEGISHRVVHATAGKTLVIDPESTVSDIVAPADYMTLGKKGWSLTPIFKEKMSDEEFREIEDKDLIYKVALPIKKERGKTVYHFYFKTFAK